MAKTQTADRHKDKWHASLRDVPPDVWSRVRSGAAARGINMGEYVTRCILLAETVRDAVDDDLSMGEFSAEVTERMEELGLGAVRT